MTNGGVLAGLSSVSSATITSMSPVAIFGLVMPSGRGLTWPLTWITNSLRSDSASLKVSGET